MACYVFTFPTRWIFDAVLYAWLIWFLQPSTDLECLWRIVLFVGSSIRSIGNLGFRPNKKNMEHSLWWSTWCNCMRRLIFEHGISEISFQFLLESSTLQLSSYSFSQLGHCTGGDKVMCEVFSCYKALTGMQIIYSQISCLGRGEFYQRFQILGCNH